MRAFPAGVAATDVDFASTVAAMRAAKLDRLGPHLRDEMDHRWSGGKPDFMTAPLRSSADVAATSAISSNRYDKHALDLIHSLPDGLILDCGSGRRGVYFPNVVNFEIADYDTTDVIGVGEELPFKDSSFDAVISIAVLEHVRNPFRCAEEIVRVLKPGGRLICCVPFLQPYHGYPQHYFNMSHQGLRALFEDDLQIDDHQVTGSMLPIWTLSWMINSWAEGLPAKARNRFMNMTLKDLAGPPRSYLQEEFVQGLSQAKNFELASATMLFASKPVSPRDPPVSPLGRDHYFKGARMRRGRSWLGKLRKLWRGGR